MNTLVIYQLDQFSLISKSIDIAVILLSVVVLMDLIIKFKRPINLKIILLLIVLSITMSSIIKFLSINEVDNFFFFTFCKIIALFGLLNFFSHIYFNYFRKLIYYFTIFAVIFFFIAQYYIYNNHVQPYTVNGSVYMVEIMPIYAGFKLPIIFQITRLVIVFVTFSLLSYFLYNIIFRINYDNVYYKKIKYFTISIQLFTLSMLVLFLIRNIFKIENLYFNIFILSYFRIFLLLILLYRPNFLNRASTRISFSNLFYNKLTNISEIEFTNKFYNEFYFKNKCANIVEFSNILNEQVDDINYYVNQKYGLTFDDLINKNRIEYFVEIIKNPEYQNYTIEALSKEIGFTSRSSFYKPFKRFHGGNPSDLIEVYVN